LRRSRRRGLKPRVSAVVSRKAPALPLPILVEDKAVAGSLVEPVVTELGVNVRDTLHEQVRQRGDDAVSTPRRAPPPPPVTRSAEEAPIVFQSGRAVSTPRRAPPPPPVTRSAEEASALPDYVNRALQSSHSQSRFSVLARLSSEEREFIEISSPPRSEADEELGDSNLAESDEKVDLEAIIAAHDRPDEMLVLTEEERARHLYTRAVAACDRYDYLADLLG